MDATGLVTLVVGAAALGLIGQYAGRYVGRSHYRLEWIATSIGGFVGAYAASELLGAANAGPEFDGVLLGPALIGDMVVGGLVLLVLRTWAPAEVGHAR